jgi:hypothetical protein
MRLVLVYYSSGSACFIVSVIANSRVKINVNATIIALLHIRALWLVARGLKRAAREARTITGWAGTGSKSDGHGRPSTFLLNRVCRFYKKMKILYFSVLISFPEGFTLGHDRKV